jgi:hypothetical protein
MNGLSHSLCVFFWLELCSFVFMLCLSWMVGSSQFCVIPVMILKRYVCVEKLVEMCASSFSFCMASIPSILFGLGSELSFVL